MAKPPMPQSAVAGVERSSTRRARKGEYWQDLIWDLPVKIGVVSERVRRVMESLGLRPVL